MIILPYFKEIRRNKGNKKIFIQNFSLMQVEQVRDYSTIKERSFVIQFGVENPKQRGRGGPPRTSFTRAKSFLVDQPRLTW